MARVIMTSYTVTINERDAINYELLGREERREGERVPRVVCFIRKHTFVRGRNTLRRNEERPRGNYKLLSTRERLVFDSSMLFPRSF